MAGDVRVTVRGVEELHAELARLPVRMENKIIFGGLRAAAIVIRDEVKAKAPVRHDGRSLELSTGKRKSKFYKPGFMKAAFRIKLGKEDGFPVAWVHSGRAFYADFYERGTVHQPARPFFRPAVEAAKGAAFRAMSEGMTVRFEETFSGQLALPSLSPALLRE